MHCEVSVLYFFLSLAFQLLDVDPSLYFVHVSVSRVISRPRAPTVSCGAPASTSCPFWGSKRRIEGLDRPTRTNCLCTARGQFSRSVQTVPAAASCHQRAASATTFLYVCFQNKSHLFINNVEIVFDHCFSYYKMDLGVFFSTLTSDCTSEEFTSTGLTVTFEYLNWFPIKIYIYHSVTCFAGWNSLFPCRRDSSWRKCWQAHISQVLLFRV